MHIHTCRRDGVRRQCPLANSFDAVQMLCMSPRSNQTSERLGFAYLRFIYSTDLNSIQLWYLQFIDMFVFVRVCM